MDQNQVLQLVDKAAEAVQQGDMPGARALVDQALAADCGWPAYGFALRAAGYIARMMGDDAGAVAHLQRFLSEAGETGNGMSLQVVNDVRYKLGMSLRQAGNFAGAMAQYELARGYFAENGPKPYHLGTCTALAWAACMAGDVPAATFAMAEAESLVQSDDDRLDVDLGQAFLQSLQGTEARENAGATCLRLMADQGAPGAIKAHAAWIMGNLRLHAGDLNGAADAARQAREFAATEHDPRYQRDIDSLQAAITAATV